MKRNHLNPVLRFFLPVNLALLLLTLPLCISLAQKMLPVTHFRFNDDTSKLQFAIISDLWGGYIPGAFDDAAHKLELLQPQFVMSVGDLIDGKTYDAAVLENQWSEFNVLVDSLSMPFFYVPGNHDISNPWMETEYLRMFGRTYYHFIRKNVLFLCINTQDGGSSGILDEQVVYFKKAIEENPDVRWTFVFMHRPVWQGTGDKQDGYEKIEAELSGRNYTLFSGHSHTYLKNNKQGNNHFVLGSTGSGTNKLGEKFGEFDHITWVTVNNGLPPKIINIKLDGMVMDDIVNEKTRPITRTLINQEWLVTPKHVSQNRLEDTVRPVIFFNNPTDYPLSITGTLSNTDSYSIDPKKLDLVIQAGSKHQEVLTLSPANQSQIDLSELPFIEFELSGSYTYENYVYEIPVKRELYLDWKHLLPESSDAEQLMNARFENPDTADFTDVRIPEYLLNNYYWNGAGDSFFQFKLARDRKYLYLVALFYDDQLVVAGKPERDWIHIDFEDKNGSASRFKVHPDPIKPSLMTEGQTGLSNKDIEWKSAIEGEHTIKLWMRVPLKKIAGNLNSFRFNIGYHDQDNQPISEHSTLYWKPIWGSETDYPFSGTFILNALN